MNIPGTNFVIVNQSVIDFRQKILDEITANNERLYELEKDTNLKRLQLQVKKDKVQNITLVLTMLTIIIITIVFSYLMYKNPNK